MNQFEEQIRLAIVKKKMSLGELAKLLGMAQANFSKKLTKNNFNENDMRKIAELLDMELVIELKDK